MKSRTKKNKSRARIRQEERIEGLRRKGEILVEDMKNYPAAPLTEVYIEQARSDALRQQEGDGFLHERNRQLIRQSKKTLVSMYHGSADTAI